MKKIFFGILGITASVAFLFQSCDKVENPYPPQYVDIDASLLYGVTVDEYINNEWPTFTQNTNTNANVLIEDFTGHLCVNCPTATLEVETIEAAHEGRVFVTGIHAGPNGNLDLQKFTEAPYLTNYTNAQGIEIAVDLTSDESVFNPFVCLNRKAYSGTKFPAQSFWDSYVSTILSENVLKVNLQASTHYYPETRGLILHTEVELKEEITNDLYQVVYLVEDSMVSIQKTLGSWTPPYQDVNYVHRDIHRGCIDGLSQGRKLTDAMKVDKFGDPISGDKYYLNYSYKLPDQYNKENMHLLIFVYDKTTKEVLQVIKQEIIE